MQRNYREDRYREEAERLAQLSVDEQSRAIATIRALADGENVSRSQRAQQHERAAMLEWLLQRLNGSIR
jgi:hypothetical protein